MSDGMPPRAGAAEFEAWLGSVRRLVRERLIPAEPRLEGQETLPEDLTALLREAGLFGISIPARYGGLGLSMEQQVRVMFEVRRASSVFRARFSTTIGLGSQPILYNGREDQRQEWLPRMATGEVTAAFCLTEPEAGSGAGGLRTRATREGEHYVLDGVKRYITNARQADVFIVMARTDPASKDASGISAFIVPAGTEGVRCGPPDRKMGQDGSATSKVFFEGARVPAVNLIGGREGGGFKTAMRGINHARLHVAVTCVGQAEGHPDFPELVPLSAQLGWPDFNPMAWQALMAPAGTPEPIVERLAAIVAAALRREENAARLRATGALPSGMPPAEFRRFLAREVAAWGGAVRASGATVGG